MKRLSCFVLILLVGAVAVPALADVTVTATITKDFDEKVTETLNKVVNMTITVKTPVPALSAGGAAEAQALANVTTEGNTVTTSTGDSRTASLGGPAPGPEGDGSILTNLGIVGMNQDVGNMANQANSVAVGLTDSSGAAADAQAEVSQANTGNSSTETSGPTVNASPGRHATIQNSINDNIGVVGFNQNAGNMNIQTNTMALAVGLTAQVALSEAALGQTNQGNNVTEVGSPLPLDPTLIQDSLISNAGVVSVNQTTGNMNNQGSSFSFSGVNLFR
jgi:hypothetical protein